MHIERCALNSRESQKKIYTSFYGYAMAVCDRYTNNQDDAIEILNDGFLKVFKEIYRYKPAYSDVVSSFKGWLRKIMVYTAIDHFRKNHKHQFTTDLDNGVIQVASHTEDALDRISYEEITEKLSISIGTSKSNLAKARRQLQKILFQQNQIQVTKNAV